LKKGIIIQASSRSKGNTFTVVSFLQEQTGFDVVDLSTKQIGHFDYEFKNQGDDFNALFKKIVTNYDTIILATPIYWYTMSGLLKVFLDRISDFLKIEKEFGRQLRGKQMASLSCSDADEIFEGFTMPFIKSADYLGLQYKGHIHTWLENGIISEAMKTKIKTFSQSIITEH
jgi:multimeric flavodoxin WrbA